LPSLDKELLVRSAAFRWLYRGKQAEMAAFVYADNEMRSRQLSSGTATDVMGLLRDVDRDAVLASGFAPVLRQAS
jgi:hypothetical protein